MNFAKTNLKPLGGFVSCMLKISDGVSRLGLEFFGVSVSKVSGLVSVSKDFGLGLERFVSRL